MKHLFDNLKNISYEIGNKTYIIRDIFDIHLQYEKIKKYQDSSKYYFKYRTIDGESWDSIAYKYYKDVNIYWILIILNGTEDLFYDFVLTNTELSLATKYLSSQNNQITQDLYENTVDENDQKRVIKILKQEYLIDFQNDFFNYELITY